MTDVSIDLGGVPEMLYALGVNASDMHTGLAAGANYLKAQLAAYPPERHAPQPFVSDRQRRGFFAKLRSGEIEVPYRRGRSPGSRKLGQSWRVRSSPLEAVVGTTVSYAPLVMARGDQTRYHRATGWRTAEDVQERDGERAVEIVKETVLSKMGR